MPKLGHEFSISSQYADSLKVNYTELVFYSGPIGIIAIAIIAGSLPSTKADKKTFVSVFKRASRGAWRRVDAIGACIILVASILLVCVFEEAETRFVWDSAAMIASLVISILLWVLFPIWEHYAVNRKSSKREPIFPMTLLRSRHISAMMLYGSFTSFPFMGVVVNLFQRYQAVNSVPPLLAGVYLLPLLICSPLASAICGLSTSSLKIPPFYLVIAGAILQVLGIPRYSINDDSSQ